MSDTFISYSRKNAVFVRRLIDKLILSGKDTWVDWEDIPLTAPNWWNEIKAGIEAADSFVFIMSPASMASVVCNMELDYAFELRKRIIPVVYQEIETRDAFASIADFEADVAMEARLAGEDPLRIARDNWQNLSYINWVFFRETDDFDAAFEKLVVTVETDLEYVKAHTRYLIRSQEWQRANRRPDLLLFGAEIAHAEAWLTRAEEYAAAARQRSEEKVAVINPLPQAIQRDYIMVSRQADKRRRRLARSMRISIAVLVAALIVGALIGSSIVANTQQEVRNVQATSERNVSNANTQVAAAGDQLATATQALVTATWIAELEAEGRATLSAVNRQVADAFVTVTQAAIDREITAGFANAMLVLRDNSEAQLSAMNGLVQAYPQEALAYHSRGLMYDTQGDPGAAIADYDRAIQLNPQYPEAYYNRGLTRYALGDLEAAIADYDHAIQLDPQYAAAYSNRGLAHYIQGDLEGAIADYDRAIQLDPQFATAYAYYNRGLAHQTRGDLEAAIADYDRAIQLDPQNADAYMNRGIAYQNQGDLEAAIADFDRAIQLVPQFADAFASRGDSYYELGQDYYEAAIADYQRFGEITGGLPLYMRVRIAAIEADLKED